MKQFLKFTFIKIALALIIVILPLIGFIISRGAVNPNSGKITWGIYYISEAFFIFLYPINFLIKLLSISNFLIDLENKYSGTSLYNFVSIVLLLFYLVYCYLWSCLIIFLIKKIKETARN